MLGFGVHVQNMQDSCIGTHVAVRFAAFLPFTHIWHFSVLSLLGRSTAVAARVAPAALRVPVSSARVLPRGRPRPLRACPEAHGSQEAADLRPAIVRKNVVHGWRPRWGFPSSSDGLTA